MVCRNCGKVIPDNTHVCPHCECKVSKSVSASDEKTGKKFAVICSLIIVIPILILCLLYSCSSPSRPVSSPSTTSSSYTGSSYSYDAAEETEHVHTPVPIPDAEPTCDKDGHTGGSKCSVCGFILSSPTVVEKLGHSCRYGICGSCGKPIRYGVLAPETGIWSRGFYKDEFGDLTNTRVVFSDTINGSFSNSATTGSRLSVVLYAEASCIKIALYEYDSIPVSYGFYPYEVHIKHGDAKETLNVELEDSRLVFERNNFTKIKYILCSGEDIQFVIYESGGTSTYKFSVSASNFYTECTNTFSSPDHPYWDQESVEKNNFLSLAKKYPGIGSFSASSMLRIYDFIESRVDIHVEANDYTDTKALTQIVFEEAADEFSITVDQVTYVFVLVDSNRETVEIAAGYEE